LRQRGSISRWVIQPFLCWRSVISQLPSIPFRKSAFQIGCGDAVTM
jgi:hypothetical protein